MSISHRRFFVPRDCIRNGRALLPPDEAYHLRRVLRLKDGDEAEVFDGEGNGYSGVVVSNGLKAEVRDLKRIQPVEDILPSIILAPALIKQNRFEWILEKGTELGVQEFIPLRTQFCAAPIPDARMEARLERWQRIVRESSKQSRRLDVPRIRKPVGFSCFLAAVGKVASAGRFLLDEKAHIRWDARNAIPNRLVLCVGPEGGWDSAEVSEAERAGFRIFSLGSMTLRAETAAVAAVALFRLGTVDFRLRNEQDT